MTEQNKPSGSFTAWENTMCNSLAPARDQCQSAWHDGYASAKQEWVGLTEDELKALCDEWQIIYGGYVKPFAETIEAKLKEKNGYANKKSVFGIRGGLAHDVTEKNT